MNHSLFRYFDNEDYAQAFLSGKIFCHNLQYYVNIEDDQVRGDPNDGSLVHQPPQGLEISNLTQRTKFAIPGAQFKSKTNIEEIYALCMSESLNQKIIAGFKATYCVEIRSKRLFLQSVRSALTGKGNTAHAGRMTYYHPSSFPLARWAVPAQICLRKDQGYRWQDEYRVVFGMPRYFDVENVSLTIKQRTSITDTLQNGIEKNLTFEIENIRAFCTLHNCG